MIHQLTREEISNIQNARAYLIDVRSSEEVAAQRIPAALHWDVQQMAQGRFPNIPKDSPVFVYCQSGNRSSEAQRLLGGAGFTDAHDMGGIDSIPAELRS